MASYMNTLGAVSRRGQWRFRHIFRSGTANGRLDTSDAGLIDFSTASNVVFTVTRRHPVQHHAWCKPVFGSADGYCEPAPVLSASLATDTLMVPILESSKRCSRPAPCSASRPASTTSGSAVEVAQKYVTGDVITRLERCIDDMVSSVREEMQETRREMLDAILGRPPARR